MILTDDNFATIVHAVELGRALYDNLMRYIRFQMACLFGFIATFLGSSLFFIAGGVPFLPLQTLWVNFTVQVSLAIGLGYGAPREGLMQDAPRDPDQPILPRRLLTWVVVAGLVMAIGTLGTIQWATGQFGEEVARSMGLTVFSLFNIAFALETSNEEKSIFAVDLRSNATLLKAAGVAFLFTVLATETSFLQRLLGTVSLDTRQFAICLVVALSMFVIAEGRKLLGIRTTERPAVAASEPAAAPAA